MKFARQFLDYFLFGNIFIAVGAISLYVFTCLSLNLTFHPILLFFIFFATISSYNLHSYFHPSVSYSSKRLEWIKFNRRSLRISLIFMLIATIIIFLWISWLWRWIIPIAVLTLIYSLPRIVPGSIKWLQSIQFLKVFYLAMVWTLVTVFLPLSQDTQAFSSNVLLFAVNQYFFILQLCLLFDQRDRYLMKPGQRLSVLKFLDERKFNLLFYSIFTVTILTSLLIVYFNQNLKNFISIATAELFLILVYKKSKNSTSDYWYAVVVDGILIIPGIVLLLLKIR